MRGDWNDVDAAAEMGTWWAECVWVGPAESPTPNVRVYHLRHISDARGTLTATRREPAGESGENIEITLKSEMGRFGDAELERKIVTGTARRLAELRGVEVAPLPE